jgi:hypothetical protein
MFRCVDAYDRRDWHRFTLPVLRVEAHDRRCLECEQHVAPHAGPVVPAGYHYLSRVISGALADVATGSTYAQASSAARAALAREAGNYREWVEYSTNGQLAADWVEVFADVAVPAERSWPPVLLLDATKFWRREGGARVAAFTLLCAYGYDVLEGPQPPPDEWEVRPKARTVNGRIVRISLVERENQHAWAEFLRELPGIPQVVVGDGHGAVRNAVQAVWGDETAFVRCVYHWRLNLEEQIKFDLVFLTGRLSTHADVADHPIWAETRRAFSSTTAWETFKAQLTEVVAEHPRSQALGWIAAYDDDIVAQLNAIGVRPGPQSTGPLEQDIQRLRQLLARRVQALRNGPRTRSLIHLLTAGIANRVNRDEWGARIYDHLEANNRRPARSQRMVAGIGLFDEA